MPRSATEVMQDAIFAAVIDSIMALKAASKGLPNTLVRDLNAIHANTTFADLPAEVQAAVTASVRDVFSRLLKEGYSVSAGGPPPQRSAPTHRPHSGRSGPRPPRRHGSEPGRKPPGKGGGPGRGPRPPKGGGAG